jgi:fatty-acyl-CoA synthase
MAEMPKSRTVPRLLEEQSLAFPGREAIVDGENRLAYRELRERVLRTAKGLHAIGVRRGARIGILMGNRSEWIVSFLAAQQLGATVVCLSTWATQRELQQMLCASEVEFLVCVHRFGRTDYCDAVSSMRQDSAMVASLRQLIWVSDDPPLKMDEGIAWENLEALGSEVEDKVVDEAGRGVREEDIAMILFTSGSTAAPKGILLQHAQWIENGFHIGERQHVTQIDRLWLSISLFWSFGSVNALPNVLSHGACVVLQERFDAARALDLLQRESCTLIYATPNMIQALVEQQRFDNRDLSKLRSGAMIGAPHQIQAAVDLGATEICNIYGLSETYGNCAVTDAHEALEIRREFVGTALPGMKIRITAADGTVLSPGEVGEIRVQGRLFKGYLDDEAKTREAMDDDGFFRTGDLGILDGHGRLQYRGRLKEMVKSGGINVAPVEVEEVLQRHQAVETAYVIGLPDAGLDEVLGAVIVLKRNLPASEEELGAFCRKELAAYKVPSRFRFTTHDELPLTATGKIQKSKLRDLFPAGGSR